MMRQWPVCAVFVRIPPAQPVQPTTTNRTARLENEADNEAENEAENEAIAPQGKPSAALWQKTVAKPPVLARRRRVT